MALDPAVAEIVTRRDWLAALGEWDRQSYRPLCEEPPFELSRASWLELRRLLEQTGRFDVEGGRLVLRPEGRELLSRARELAILLDLEAHGEIPPLRFPGAPNGAALELGCGTGHILVVLARLGYEPVIGYDLSPFAIDIADFLLAREDRSGRLYTTDASALAEVADGEVALIYSRGTMHVLGVARLAAAVRRVLMHGGYVVAEVKAITQTLRLREMIRRDGWRRGVAQVAVLIRTLIHEATGRQLSLGVGSIEIAWTRRGIRRFAASADLEIVSCDYNPAFKSYDVVFRRGYSRGP